MIDIIVDGVDSKKRENLIYDAVMFYAYLLMGEDADRISVEVTLTDLEDAACTVFEDDSEDSPSFSIEINPEQCDNMYKTLAHEMVHVKQYFYGELQANISFDNGEFVIHRTWMGEAWSPRPYEHPYFDCPWEIEAYGREFGLYYRWQRRNEK